MNLVNGNKLMKIIFVENYEDWLIDFQILHYKEVYIFSNAFFF